MILVTALSLICCITLTLYPYPAQAPNIQHSRTRLQAVGDQPVQTHCALPRPSGILSQPFYRHLETVQCSAQRWPENNASVSRCLTQAISYYFLEHPVVRIPAPEIRENMLRKHKHNQFEYNSECTVKGRCL